MPQQESRIDEDVISIMCPVSNRVLVRWRYCSGLGCRTQMSMTRETPNEPFSSEPRDSCGSNYSWQHYWQTEPSVPGPASDAAKALSVAKFLMWQLGRCTTSNGGEDRIEAAVNKLSTIFAQLVTVRLHHIHHFWFRGLGRSNSWKQGTAQKKPQRFHGVRTDWSRS